MVKSAVSSAINANICSGQSYAGHTNSGTYTDTFKAVSGCDSIRTLYLIVKPTTASTIIQSICQGQTYLGQGVGGTYIDKFTGANCGIAKDDVVITRGICDVYFPSAFTPNNDGKNDLFRVPNGNNLSDYHLVMYNRCGQKVFETNDPAKGWAGDVNGKAQNTGAFAWYCEYRKPGIVDIVSMKGTVMLIR